MACNCSALVWCLNVLIICSQFSEDNSDSAFSLTTAMLDQLAVQLLCPWPRSRHTYCSFFHLPWWRCRPAGDNHRSGQMLLTLLLFTVGTKYIEDSFSSEGMIEKCNKVWKGLKGATLYILCHTCKHSCKHTRTHGVMKPTWEPAAAHHRISHPYLMASLVCPWRHGGLWCNKWSGQAKVINEIMSTMNDTVNLWCYTRGKLIGLQVFSKNPSFIIWHVLLCVCICGGIKLPQSSCSKDV